MIESLTEVIECVDAGTCSGKCGNDNAICTSPDGQEAVQSGLFLIGSAHQKVAQERHKKMLLQLNPAFKSLAE